MKEENKNVLEGLTETLREEGLRIGIAAGRLDKRAIAWRVKVDADGLDSRAAARMCRWPVSLINSTDARTKCALYGKLGDKPELETLTAAEAAGVIKELGGMKAASEVTDVAKFTDALARFKANKTAASEKAGDKPAASGGGLTADEKVLAAIAANIGGMTAAGKAAAIAALS